MSNAKMTGMSELQPIPDPQTPLKIEREPIYWWDLLLAGLIYAVSVPAIYLLLRSLGMFTYGASTAFGAQVIQMGMAVFVMTRFGKSIHDGKTKMQHRICLLR